MKTWATQITAKDPIDGQLKIFAGPNVLAETIELAEEYCQLNGMGYCWVIGQLVSEIPCMKNSFEPDWSRQVDFDNLN